MKVRHFALMFKENYSRTITLKVHKGKLKLCQETDVH
jgi:hypothetical protein